MLGAKSEPLLVTLAAGHCISDPSSVPLPQAQLQPTGVSVFNQDRPPLPPLSL
jgi:hypothetical protein